MNWPVYEDYKESGVPWLGEVPHHWAVDRIKWSVESSQNGIWGSEPDGGSDDIRCVRVADFDRPTFGVHDRDVTYRKVSASERRGRLLRNGDLILEKSGGGEKNPVGFVVLYDRDEPAVTSNFIARVTLREGMEPRFWTYLHHWLYSSRLTQPSIKQTSGIQNLDQQSYFDERVCFPPADEQVLIADFLDRETAKIDALIAKQEQLIATLREDRAATITQAVTKGLNSDVETKDAGIDWMGQLPGHWEVVKLRYVATMKTGHTPSRSMPEYWENTTIPWFTLADVWQLRGERQLYLGETANLISELGLQNSAAELLPPGTVVLSRTASVGFSGIMPRAMATSQDFWNWVCGSRLEPTYLVYALRAMRPFFDSLMMGSTHQTIYQADAASIRVPLPPIQEQREIVKVLKAKVEGMDALIDKSTEMIDTLREYRSALITDAVTGRIDVREAA